ncbi:hypothetical protein D1872_306900 [compost metagenome]
MWKEGTVDVYSRGYSTYTAVYLAFAGISYCSGTSIGQGRSAEHSEDGNRTCDIHAMGIGDDLYSL